MHCDQDHLSHVDIVVLLQDISVHVELQKVFGCCALVDVVDRGSVCGPGRRGGDEVTWHREMRIF